ncbi:nuclear receptor coactivator 6-like [Teleopsis dalmanni]|uniref:nuclear receptor coactivator 6-like n=1 Tax=Teleopsis dalmanni TaxID=139649 RepID=UPI0018CE862A|nr:nuclear receptor coactivator 6-like [Teleopsis dalmanni]
MFHTKIKNRVIIFYCIYTISLSLLSTCSAATENLTNSNYATLTHHNGLPTAPATASVTTSTSTTSGSSYQSAGTRTALRIYDECARSEGGFVPCFKKKAISFIDRISHIDAITVADGVKVVRLSRNDITPLHTAFSENELESNLPRSLEDRDSKLTHMLIERLSNFFNAHSLQVSFPKLTSEEIGRGLEEGRGKMKKMMGMMMMGMAMKMMGMIPMAMGMLYILAGKALIISKIALLLAGIMGLKKLMAGRGGSSGGGGTSWSSSGGGGGWSSGGGGGYDRRSFNEAQELAYRSYSRQPNHLVYQQQTQLKQQQQLQKQQGKVQQQQQQQQTQQQQQQYQPQQLQLQQVQKS